jgi:hypothetical protein
MLYVIKFNFYNINIVYIFLTYTLTKYGKIALFGGSSYYFFSKD